MTSNFVSNRVVKMGEEHRRFARHRALTGGRIAFNHGRSTINCTIRDLATLEVASTVGIEDEFVLDFDDGTRRRCHVRRRRGASIGVEFCESDEPASLD